MEKTHPKAALKYAEDVLSGEVIACKYVKLACQRFIKDLDRTDLFFDETAAQRECNFIETLPHVKGRWAANKEKIKLEPWQQFAECNIFGFKWKHNRLRRFRESYEEVARKNAKSTRIAGRALYMFCADDEFGAEIYSGATSERQAWEVFRPMHQMVKRTAKLKKRYDIDVNAKSLIIMSNGSRAEPLIGKPGDGASPSFAVADEYHEHQSDDLYETMVTGMGAREQPLMSAITTAGSNFDSPCYEKRGDAIRVLEGTVEDDSLFAIIYTIDEGDKWDDPDVLIKANPNIEVSVSREFLLTQLHKAKRSARLQNAFRTKHCNQWVGAKTAWMNMVAWQRQKTDLTILDFIGESCHVALDLATQNDCSSVAAVFKRNGQYYVFCKHFVCEAAFEWNDRYKVFSLNNHIEVTPGNAQDFGEIRSHIDWLASNFTVRSVTFDPWQSAQMMQELQETGLTVHKATQQFSAFSDAMKTTESLVLDGNLFHSGDPVLTWMVGNTAALKNKDDHIKPVKANPNNPTCKIDAVAATIMAIRNYLDDGPTIDDFLNDPVTL